jgi:competence protein ComEA
MRRFLCAIAIVGTTLVPCVSPVSAEAQKPPAAQSNEATSPPRSRSASRPAAKARATAAAPVNLNSATVAQLQTLPGIGASTAQRILDFRQKNGAFKKIEELMNVKGIGEKSFLKLKPLVTTGAEKGERASAQE